MKYKIITLMMVFIMIVGAIGAQSVEPRKKRYHQHLEAKPKEQCMQHDEAIFCTHLPFISITTDGPMPLPYITDESAIDSGKSESTPNDETVSATVKYYDHETANNHLTDTAAIEEKALIRIRGASSRSYDKKSYALKFKQDNLVDNKDVSLSGMVADNEWVLNGPYLDKSWIRNYLCYNLAGEIMDYAPNVRFCELFLNGQYEGIYLLVESIKYNDHGRVNITETDPDMTITSYIVEVDRGTRDKSKMLPTFGSMTQLTTKYGTKSGQLEIVYPSKTITEEQRQYIADDISRFEKAITSYDYKNSKLGYKNYIAIKSFVDYFIINEFTLNYDSMGLSTYLYKDIGDRFHLCVWDFNSAFDYYEYPVAEPHGFETQKKMWYSYLFRDEYFVRQVVNRYRALRKTFLSDDYLNRYIDEVIAYLGEAIERNNAKWGYSFKQGIEQSILKPVHRNPTNHDEAIEQLKRTIKERGDYMDKHIEKLYTLSHESINKKYNHKTEGE